MYTMDISFEDIVIALKKDLNQNIYELENELGCSQGLIYRRVIKNGFKGIRAVKKAIVEGRL